MPTTVRCPHCDEAIRVADHEGPRVECPSCGTRFERPQGGAGYALPADERDLDLGRSAGPAPGAQPMLLRGSLLQIIANALHLLALLLAAVLVMAALDRPSGGSGPDPFTGLLLMAGASIFLAAWVLDVIAAACWAMVPTRDISRALGVAVLCFSLLVIARGADFLVLLGSPLGRDGLIDDQFSDRRYSPAFALVTYYLDSVRMMVLAAYLAAAARDTGRRKIQGMAMLLALLAPVFLLGPVALASVTGAAGLVGTELRLLFLLLLMVGALATVAWTLVVVFQLRHAWERIGRQLRDD
jgi:hypothetical protein